MIHSIEMCFNHGQKVNGSKTIRFTAGVNVLVGPNGSGKSTVLRALHTCERCRKAIESDPAVHYFNAESMNPHNQTGAAGTALHMLLRTRGMFSSHGEIMKAALVALPLREGDVLLVDEPEAGQDLAGVLRIRDGIGRLSARRVQVIAASHHPALFDAGTVIELEPGYAARVCDEMCRMLHCGSSN